MTAYTTKEKLLAIVLLETARRAKLTKESEQNALTLATEYARTSADYSVLAVLEYPDTTRATS